MPSKYVFATHHVVDGVVDGLDDLHLPVVLALWPVEHVVDVDRAEEDLWPHPLEEHGVPVLTGQVDHPRLAGRAHVRPHEERERGLALVLQGERADPNLVLRVRLWKRAETTGDIYS